MLLPFFRTLLQYAQMDYDRRTLMNNLAQRFPRLLKANHAFFKLTKFNLRSPSKKTLNKTDAYASSRWVLPGGHGVQTLTFSGSRYDFRYFVIDQEKKSSCQRMLTWPFCAFFYSKSSPELVLQWIIETTEQGGIVPHMRLLPRMHKKCESKCDLDMMPHEIIMMHQQFLACR
jgi:hypothetical protein